jgi:hypothetical protein
MTAQECLRGCGRSLAAAGGFALGAYAAYVAFSWTRFGDAVRPGPDEADPLLDRFIPAYDVVERHHVRVAAPASVTLDAARTLDMGQSPFVQAIFKGRELIMGAESRAREPRGLLDEVRSLGWVVLDEVPDREIVLGAVTKPWEANPVFRPIPAGEFAAFAEPQYVKIAWTLRADPVGAAASIFRTETRALATDDFARERFRAYWAFLSPGIWLIRQMMTGPVRKEAERRAAAAPGA